MSTVETVLAIAQACHGSRSWQEAVQDGDGFGPEFLIETQALALPVLARWAQASLSTATPSSTPPPPRGLRL